MVMIIVVIDRHGLYHGHDHRGHHVVMVFIMVMIIVVIMIVMVFIMVDHRGHHDRHGRCGHALRTMHPPYRKAVRFPLD